ncbi:HAD hydrolase-like protein [Dolichospermum planctonicum CS-1226]|uniref:HAD hydrolase-like protein n=1 Tax=Dolichospermum planctonicum CS-1226 TaxID=3021751 RepID=A0ABT5AH28_9CYAN|nr:HAD family hydrolase [Dolichospermum planctonicum]MDB9536237.1 HAD hydrolase-like protein [Dolichospermum planctonicum CS-1226]
MNLHKYKTLIFDCDGVVLNSNKVKTQAFYNSALDYGEQAAQSLVEYHVKNGGISRYKKFHLFLNELIPKGAKGASLEELLKLYAEEVRRGLMTCEVGEGLSELRQQTSHCKWLIVSGGDQNELRDIFNQRGLDNFFDGGIFGSPDSKDIILKRELANGNIQAPAVFFGDSKYDYQAADSVGLDFIFLSGWTEVKDWQSFCDDHQLPHFHSLSDLAKDGFSVSSLAT